MIRFRLLGTAPHLRRTCAAFLLTRGFQFSASKLFENNLPAQPQDQQLSSITPFPSSTSSLSPVHHSPPSSSSLSANQNTLSSDTPFFFAASLTTASVLLPGPFPKRMPHLRLSRAPAPTRPARRAGQTGYVTATVGERGGEGGGGVADLGRVCV
ncbi:hypothetical protein MY11210_003400 [Beauveria gryllotalpidicola]